MKSPWCAELELAKVAAQVAADCLNTRAATALTILDDTGRDIKLAADRAAEAIIIDRLQESGYAILAEESGELGDLNSGAPVWVVDPLDGTMNYSRDIPLCCTSIALMKDGQPLLGVVQDFNRKETFVGLASGGAWLNDEPISVSAVDSASRAILATGLPSFRDYSASALQPTIKQFGRFKKVRMLGSAALMLAYLAAGRVDAYQEDDIMLWDVAAGLALVQGAGGVVVVEKSTRNCWARRVWCASNASMWNEIDDTEAST